MEDMLGIIEAAKGLSQNQKSIIRSLFQFGVPVTIQFFNSSKAIIIKLQERGLVTIQDEKVSLTLLGISISKYWYHRTLNELKDPEISSKKKVSNQERIEKSNQFLELYKQGLSYQDIGDKYGLSRERVRQILNPNVEFRKYLREREESKITAELERKEKLKINLQERSLASRFLERVVDLWDFEKNNHLDPEKTLAHSSAQVIWLKCPIDGHSWNKKVSDITAIWKNNGTSGCPACAGKMKKPEKQPSLIAVYKEFIQQYWNYNKNGELDLDPEVITLGSNRKAWFKCPHDCNEWQTSIASTISQQWSKGNAGYRVCNGTDERKRGEWKRRDPIAIEFPDELAKYWLYETNNELGLDPMKLTIGSSKEAFFKCPIDGHEWVATITVITKLSWRKGNSGCPACRGFTAIEATSLISNYPNRVAQYWDYEKNNKLGIYPDKFTRGSTKEA